MRTQAGSTASGKLVTCLECGRRVPPPREWTDGIKPCTALHGTDAAKAASRAAEHRARRSGLVELARRDTERYGNHTYRSLMTAAEIAAVEPLVRGWDHAPTPRMSAAPLEDLRD